MASLISALFAPFRSKTDEKLALDTGRKVGRKYLVCFRLIEKDADSARLLTSNACHQNGPFACALLLSPP